MRLGTWLGIVVLLAACGGTQTTAPTTSAPNGSGGTPVSTQRTGLPTFTPHTYGVPEGFVLAGNTIGASMGSEGHTSYLWTLLATGPCSATSVATLSDMAFRPVWDLTGNEAIRAHEMLFDCVDEYLGSG
jgi:hypothetical protein